MESSSRTWWRARREIQLNWRELALWCNGDGVEKEKMRRRRAEMTRRIEMKKRGLRIALRKVKRRGLLLK